MKLKVTDFVIVTLIHFIICGLCLFLNHIAWIYKLLGASLSPFLTIFHWMLIFLTFPVRDLMYLGSDLLFEISEQNYGFVLFLLSSIFYGLFFGYMRIPQRIIISCSDRWMQRRIHHI